MSAGHERNAVMCINAKCCGHFEGHHIWPPGPETGPVLPSERGQVERWASAPGGLHLWRRLGLWRKIHLLFAGQADV